MGTLPFAIWKTVSYCFVQ